MRLSTYWPRLPALGLPFFFLALLSAQNTVVPVAPPAKVTGQRNQTLSTKIIVEMKSGYHVNSNTPSDEYLIPLRLKWKPGPVEVIEIVYPKPHMETYSFTHKPLSVFTGGFELLTRFKVPPSTSTGLLT